MHALAQVAGTLGREHRAVRARERANNGCEASGAQQSSTGPAARRRRSRASGRPAARAALPRRRRRARRRAASSPRRGPAPWRNDEDRASTVVDPAQALGRRRRGSSAAAAATSARSCAATPRASQRRPEVTTRSRRQAAATGACSRALECDVLHQRDCREPADRGERGARHEDRLVAGRDAGQARARVHQPARPTASSGLRPSIAHVEAAPARAGGRERRRAPRASAPGGRRVSACRKSSTSPVAASRAGVHLRSRGRAARRSRGRRAARRAPRVASRLPPSTTITSWPAARSGCSAASVAAMPAASSSAGMMMESRRCASDRLQRLRSRR